MSNQEPLTPFESVFSIAIVHPLDTVKTVMQAHNKASKGLDAKTKKDLGIIETLLQIVRTKGVRSLYRGFVANIINTFIQQFAYFWWYTVVREVYIKRVLRASGPHPTLHVGTELVLGAVSAGLAQLFTTPMGVVATRQQIGGDHHEEDDSMLGHIRDIYRSEGITGFWRGLKPSLVLTVNPAITYGVYERLKSVVLATSDGVMTPGKSFVIGALSKTLATVVTFPYILSKTRLQAKNAQHSSAIDVLAHIYQKEGFFGWYRGMHAQITKAVLSQALLFYFREQIEIWTRSILAISKGK